MRHSPAEHKRLRSRPSGFGPAAVPISSRSTPTIRPSPDAVSAARDLAFEAICETCDCAASYATSACEAAYRGSQHALGVHLGELRICVVAAIGAFKELEAGALKDGGAA